MTTQYQWIFNPGQIGKLKIKNRLCNSPAIPNFSTREGRPTQREADYYAEKAKGGFGIVFISGTSINTTTAVGFTNQPRLIREFLPDWKQLTEAVRQSGARCALQIYHPGRQTHPHITGGHIPEAPSAIPCEVESLFPGYQVHAMSRERIAEVVQEYAEAAALAKEAGVDILEIHAAHGYLPQQFLSPYSNQRTDEYGGSPESRFRFIRELYQAIRSQVGPDYPLGIRISADELVDGGLTTDEMTEVAKGLEELGFDYISVSAGLYSWMGLYSMIAAHYTPPLHLEPLVGEIKEVVSLPVFQYGGITTPEMAEEVLERRTADFVILNRASIADPHLPRKVEEGKEEDIRLCIRCNNGCIDRLFMQLDITCTQNPELGREREFAQGLKPVTAPQRVLVVGGGPAGLACARYARLRGHEVLLYEREAELGGLNRYASRAPNREDFGEVANYYSREVRRLGVEIHLKEELDREKVKTLDPQVVVVATGSEIKLPVVKGLRRSDGRLADRVVTSLEVLSGAREVQGRAVVIGGNHLGVQVARTLSERGVEVTIVEALPTLNQDFDGSLIWFGFLLPDLERRGIRVVTGKYAKEIVPEGLVVDGASSLPPYDVGPVVTKWEEELIRCDAIVVGTGREPSAALFGELQGLFPQLYLVGDAVKPRWTHNATAEGATAALQF